MLKENEVRIIKVGEAAIRELIYETIIENGPRYFDLPNNDNVCYEIQLDLQRGNMICIAHEMDIPQEEINVEKIDDKTGVTTQSFFASNRYISMILTKEE